MLAAIHGLYLAYAWLLVPTKSMSDGIVRESAQKKLAGFDNIRGHAKYG
jgi:hypothetical protein